MAKTKRISKATRTKRAAAKAARRAARRPRLSMNNKTVRVGRHTFLLDVGNAAIYVAVPAQRRFVRIYLPEADVTKVVDAAVAQGVL